MRIALPLSPPALLVLCAVWLAPGLIGHSPWKSDDAIGIGVVHQMVSHGDWLLPRLAGEFYPDDGPLYYWIAASFARLFAWLLPVHDAARLAGGACIVLALVFLRQAGRAFDAYGRRDTDARDNDNGRRRGDGVMVVFIGSVGLLLHAHEAISDAALLAALACAYYGAALVPTRPAAAGIALGCGLGAAFLTAGIAPVLPLLVALLATPLFVRDWRERNCGVALGCALVAALPWFVLWPWLLEARSPELFAAWLQKGNFAAFSQGATLTSAAYSLQTLAWFAWPAWPIALWDVCVIMRLV